MTVNVICIVMQFNKVDRSRIRSKCIFRFIGCIEALCEYENCIKYVKCECQCQSTKESELEVDKLPKGNPSKLRVESKSGLNNETLSFETADFLHK